MGRGGRGRAPVARGAPDAFDKAALKVAERMEFSPAYNRDQPVPVWVDLDITFQVQ